MGLRGPDAERARPGSGLRRGRKLPWEGAGLTRKQRVLAFLEYLPITKGKLAGRKMRLLPRQRRFIEEIYGRPDARRVRIAVDSEPRGNGKTGLLAGLALCHLLGPEAEQRGEIYSAAVDRTQSGKMFDEIVAIIIRIEEFKGRVNVVRHTKRIEVLAGAGEGSVYEALSADARKGHGLAPSLWVYDELAQVESRELLDNLQTAMGKRKRALGIIISTQAPNDEHALSRIIDDGLTGIDPSVHVDLLTAPIDADPFDIKTIRAVNPALGIFLDEGDLISEAARARRIPAFEPAFRNLRLNQRVDARAEERIATAAVWKVGNVAVDRARLKGRPCYAALDLSQKRDLTALVLAFPDDELEPGFDVLPFFWTPKDELELRVPSERERFGEWIKSGHMVAVPGPVV
jgi:phage terminase large subunit-like protein